MSVLGIEPIPADEPGEPKRPGRSLIDQIRAEYHQDTSRRTLTLSIPRTKLGVRYKAIRPEDVAGDDPDRKVADVFADFLVAACDSLVMRAERSDPWETVEVDGMPVKFDGEAASLFDWPGKSAREYVLAAFSRVPMPESAIGAHFERIEEWLRTGDDRLGES